MTPTDRLNGRTSPPPKQPPFNPLLQHIVVTQVTPDRPGRNLKPPYVVGLVSRSDGKMDAQCECEHAIQAIMVVSSLLGVRLNTLWAELPPITSEQSDSDTSVKPANANEPPPAGD